MFRNIKDNIVTRYDNILVGHFHVLITISFFSYNLLFISKAITLALLFPLFSLFTLKFRYKISVSEENRYL